MLPVRAFVCGVGGLVPTPEEEDFFRQSHPFGFILFRRNIADPDQLCALTARLREIIGREDAPVLVDQEGGRVQRLSAPHWPAYPAAATFDALPDPAEGTQAARLSARLMAHDLRAAGLDIDCLPVLDVPVPGSHDVIGDRAYSADPERVASLGRAVAEAMIAGGVLPVVKHMPGHGRARADSHLELPVVTIDRATLERTDFVPFRLLADMPVAMSAHVVFTAIDPERPATLSPTVVDSVIRGSIGFDGLLLTDDLSMQALSGDVGHRAAAAFGAGCDIALHCNGDLGEARRVAAMTPWLDGKALARSEAALACIRHTPEPVDAPALRATLDTMLAARA